MMVNNPHPTRITHSWRTRSQIQSGADNSPPCHCRVVLGHVGVLCNLTYVVCPLPATSPPPTLPVSCPPCCMSARWNKRGDAQLRQLLFVTVQPCRHSIKWPVLLYPAKHTSFLLIPHRGKKGVFERTFHPVSQWQKQHKLGETDPGSHGPEHVKANTTGEGERMSNVCPALYSSIQPRVMKTTCWMDRGLIAPAPEPAALAPYQRSP